MNCLKKKKKLPYFKRVHQSSCPLCYWHFRLHNSLTVGMGVLSCPFFHMGPHVTEQIQRSLNHSSAKLLDSSLVT